MLAAKVFDPVAAAGTVPALGVREIGTCSLKTECGVDSTGGWCGATVATVDWGCSASEMGAIVLDCGSLLTLSFIIDSVLTLLPAEIICPLDESRIAACFASRIDGNSAGATDGEEIKLLLPN